MSERLSGRKLLAIEFFSGIGAFAQACRSSNIEVIKAFDQSQSANETYLLNYGLKPSTRNLDNLPASEIPAADIWWMSPPCTPFTVRGRRRDGFDPRAQSFLNLIGHIKQCRPRAILVENVSGFSGSSVHQMLLESLSESAYTVEELDLCSTDFAVPMRRPRHFVVAVKGKQSLPKPVIAHHQTIPLASFLDTKAQLDLIVDEQIMSRYGSGFDLVSPLSGNVYVKCFTSSYWRCRKASGSLLWLPDGAIRFFSPTEILRLLGFNDDFSFPDKVDLSARFRLAGNSVDVRAIKYLLSAIEWCQDIRDGIIRN